MDWKDFVVQMISHLAWPITVTIIVLLLKNKLGDLVPRIEKFKHKDTEIAFTKAMDSIVSDASELDEESLSIDLRKEEKRLLSVIDIAPNRVIDQAFSLVDRELLKIDDFCSAENRQAIRQKDGRAIRKSAGVPPEIEMKIKHVQFC